MSNLCGLCMVFFIYLTVMRVNGSCWARCSNGILFCVIFSLENYNYECLHFFKLNIYEVIYKYLWFLCCSNRVQTALVLVYIFNRFFLLCKYSVRSLVIIFFSGGRTQFSPCKSAIFETKINKKWRVLHTWFCGAKRNEMNKLKRKKEERKKCDDTGCFRNWIHGKINVRGQMFF